MIASASQHEHGHGQSSQCRDVCNRGGSIVSERSQHERQFRMALTDLIDGCIERGIERCRASCDRHGEGVGQAFDLHRAISDSNPEAINFCFEGFWGGHHGAARIGCRPACPRCVRGATTSGHQPEKNEKNEGTHEPHDVARVLAVHGRTGNRRGNVVAFVLMRGFAVSAIAAGMLVTTASIIGCGPSLRRMHRSDMYFERCFAADFDLRISVEERRACWQAWMEHWQRDQSVERVDYVRERIFRMDPAHSEVVALATGDVESEPSMSVLELEPASGQVMSESTMTIASSTELVESTPIAPAEVVDEPPAPPSTIAPAHERRRTRIPPLPRTASPHCGEACRPSWTQCSSRCSEGDHRACLRACELELRTCARACF